MTALPTDAASTASGRATPSVRRWRRTISAQGVLTGVLVLVLGLLILGPLFEVQLRAFADGAAGYRRALEAPFLVESLWSTVWMAIGAVVIGLVFGTALAWWSNNLPRRASWLRIVPVLPIVLPAIAAVVGWSFLFAPRIGYLNQLLRLLPWWSSLELGPVNIYTLPWIIAITGIWLTAFVYVFVSAGLKAINGELLEAASVCGSKPRWVFFRVALPLLRPSLVYSSVIVLLLGLGQFTAPLLLGRDQGVHVVATDIYSFMSRVPVDLGASAALGAPLIIIGLLLVFGEKLLLGDHSRFVSQGGKSFKRVGRESKLAVVAVGTYGLVAAVLPVIGLLIVSFSPFWSQTIDLQALTLRHYAEILTDTGFRHATLNSLRFAGVAIAITLPLGYLASVVLVERRSRWSSWALDMLVTVPLGVPRIIFGMGFLFAYIRPAINLYATSTAMILVYVTLMIPFATRLMVSGRLSLGAHHVEASRVLGASWLRTQLRIVVPLMRPAIGGATALIFVLLSHEFVASLLVRAPKTQVMSTMLFDRFAAAAYPEVAVVALCMMVVTAAGLAVAFLLGGRSVLDRL